MKKMKNIIPIALMFCCFSVAAQKKPTRERVDAMKIGFITERLSLTPNEAKVFWPVYDQYSDDLEKLRKSRRENISNARQNFDEMSDAELEKAVDNEIIFRQNELEVLKKYHPEFKKILPIKKVARLYRAEEDFKRRLLDIIQERREDRRDRMDGPGPRH